MMPITYGLKVITPCLCAGANPADDAEIRVPSIRGQLRWWFRTLGGFNSLPLKGLSLRAQEDLIFGHAAGDKGTGSKLLLQIQQPKPEFFRMTGKSPPAYVLSTPLRDKERLAIKPGHHFDIRLGWRGNDFPSDEIAALISVFAHLGGLGFRSRRGFGALAIDAFAQNNLPTLTAALKAFNKTSSLILRQLRTSASILDAVSCQNLLSDWLQNWRHHGQMEQAWKWDNKALKLGRWIDIPLQTKEANQTKIGFPYARRDHNEGLAALHLARPKTNPVQPKGKDGEVFRAALGLPIIQQYSSIADPKHPESQAPKRMREVKWHPVYDQEKAQEDRDYSGEGRFASPVLIRPYLKVESDITSYHPLVVFVDVHKWPAEARVYLNGEERQVSLDLYEAMKNDPQLAPFP